MVAATMVQTLAQSAASAPHPRRTRNADFRWRSRPIRDALDEAVAGYRGVVADALAKFGWTTM